MHAIKTVGELKKILASLPDETPVEIERCFVSHDAMAAGAVKKHPVVYLSDQAVHLAMQEMEGLYLKLLSNKDNKELKVGDKVPGGRLEKRFAIIRDMKLEAGFIKLQYEGEVREIRVESVAMIQNICDARIAYS